MDWMKYLKYIAGAGLVVAGIYYVILGDIDKGWQLISWGLALLGFSATADIAVAEVKKLRR